MGFLKTSGAILIVLLLLPLCILSLIGLSLSPLFTSETYLDIAKEQNSYETIAKFLSQETNLPFTAKQTEASFAPLVSNSVSYLLKETDTLSLKLALPQEMLVVTIADLLTELPPCKSGEDPFTPELHCKPLEKTKEAFARDVIAKKYANETSLDLNELDPTIKQTLDETRTSLTHIRTARMISYGATLLLFVVLAFLTLPPRPMLRWLSIPLIGAGIVSCVLSVLATASLTAFLATLPYPALKIFLDALGTLVFSNLTFYGSIGIGIGILACIASFVLPEPEPEKD